MIEAFLAVAIVAQAAAFVWHLDRLTARHDAQTADLCQRIQAPETAVAQHVVTTQAAPVQHLPFDDDGAWLAHVQELNG